MSEDERARVVLGLYAFQRGFEVVELHIAEFRKGAVLRGDDAWILERVAVKRDDAHERRLEGEIHARLDLCRAVEAA